VKTVLTDSLVNRT